METTNQLASYIRRKTTSNTTSYPNESILQDLNVRYDLACQTITSKIQDFFWTWAFFDTVTTQNEYTIEKFTFPDSTTRDIVSIDVVSIKYKADQDFTKLKKKDFNSLDYDFSQYSEWGGEPFYFVRDTSIFIAPNALEDIVGGGKIYGNYRPQELTLSDSTTEIKIQNKNFLAYGVIADYWNEQMREDKAQFYENLYQVGLKNMVDSLSIRDREVLTYEI